MVQVDLVVLQKSLFLHFFSAHVEVAPDFLQYAHVLDFFICLRIASREYPSRCSSKGRV